MALETAQNTLDNALPDRAYCRAVSKGEKPGGFELPSSSRSRASALAHPNSDAAPKHPRDSRSRPHNHMTEGVSGNLGGADKTGWGGRGDQGRKRY